MTVGGQPSIAYTWDQNDQPLSIGTDAVRTNLAYDAAGRRTHRVLPTGVTIQYGYDQASQLTELRYVGPAGLLGNVTYAYDLIGNRIGTGGTWARSLLPASVPTSSYDPANRQLVLGGKAMTYDANGNLLAVSEGGAATTYTWDARDRLTAVSGPDYSATFGYDGTSRRTQRVINGVTTTFLHDGRDVVQETRAGATATHIRGLGLDESLVRLDGGNATGFLSDGLGSTVALVDSGGNLNTTYTYDPFGLPAATGPASDNSFLFTGREYDGGGLYYYRMRYYRPELARFLSEDPLGLGGGPNVYAYVGNAPTQYVDPYGLRCLSPEEGQKIVEKAREWVDAQVPYLEKGKTRKGADCSGGVNKIYEEAGYPYPYRTSGRFPQLTEGWKDGGRFVETTSPQPGDIASFPGHLGVYDPSGPIDPRRPRMGSRSIAGPTSSGNPAGYRHATDFGKARYYRYDTPDDPGAGCP